jgi:hypothetical protein
MRSGDYAFGGETPINAPKTGQPYADYVFGRMMKFGLEFDNDTLTIRDKQYTVDYQSWCRRYPIIDKALTEVAESLNCTYKVE